MSLLDPSEGRILVDGTPICANLRRSWQRSIAHVPQTIFLADATIAENIAFGVPADRIDFERVQQAAAQAQLADFVESHPDGYRAVVGERGVRLSGGQRQRIGIARALYKNATVLVLDEATSALDSATEWAVMTALQQLDRQLTIFMVAHRLTSLQHCDTILRLEHGRVVARGSYPDLANGDRSLAQLAQADA
jgi:ATP-binding cassette subfamily B protein